MTRARRRLLLGALVAAVLVIGAAGTMTALAAVDLFEARSALNQARDHARELEFDPAARALERAEDHVTRARGRMGFLPTRLAAAVPVAGRPLRAVQRIAAASGEVVTGARSALAVSDELPDDGELRMRDGRLPRVDWTAVEAHSVEATDAFARAEELARSVPEGFVPGPILRARDELLDEVADAKRTAEGLALGARVLPGMLGHVEVRRHLMVVQNLAEARATGGAIESVILLRADDGALDLVRADTDEDVLSTPEDTTAGHLLNLEPDFPGAARRIAVRYRERTGIRADTVIAIDVHAISRVLALTGPVTVDGRRLTPANAVDFLSREIFEHYPSDVEQSVFLGAVTQTAWTRLRDGTFAARDLLEQLGAAARERHILLWSRVRAEQRALADLGVGGGFAEPTEARAVLAVIANQPTTAEMDAFAQRRIRYRVELAPDGVATATLQVRLRHIAGDVPGPVREKSGDGQLRSAFRVWGTGDEPERFALVVPPDGARVRELAGSYATTPGQYRLRVHRQPTLRPDRVEIEIVLPPGASVEELAPGLEVDAGVLRWAGELLTDLDLWVTYG